MPCDTALKPQQTIQERAEEVRRATEKLDSLLRSKRVRVVVKAGAIAFDGWEEQDRDRITDACAYRRIMAKGTALAKAEIQRAEQMAGCLVDRRTIAAGVHSHDGGKTWHNGH